VGPYRVPAVYLTSAFLWFFAVLFFRRISKLHSINHPEGFESHPGSPQQPEAHRSYTQRLDVPQARFLGPDDHASEVLTNGNNPVLPKPMTVVDAPSYSRRRKAASKERNEQKAARKSEMPRRRSRKESNFPHRPEGGAGSKRRST